MADHTPIASNPSSVVRPPSADSRILAPQDQPVALDLIGCETVQKRHAEQIFEQGARLRNKRLNALLADAADLDAGERHSRCERPAICRRDDMAEAQLADVDPDALC